jgi:hypothetical protein
MSLAEAASEAPETGLGAPRRPTVTGTDHRLPVAYLALAAVLVVAMVGHTVNESWAAPDFWVHLGAVREFADHPLDPGNPLVVGNDADPYLSPYTWVLGAISRVSGVDGISVLAAAGLANLVLLLAGLYRLVTTLSTRRLAPPLALIFTLLAWGVSPWRWSGFFNANSIGTVLPLASTFAAALAFVGLSGTLRWLRSGARAELALVGVTTPLIITCHPFTATWTAALGLGFVAATADRRNRRRVVALAVVATGAAGLAVAWPFYALADLPGTASVFEASNAAIFRDVLPRTFLALPGLVAIWLRRRRGGRDPINLGFVAVTAMFTVAWILDRPTLGRALPAVMLMLHVTLADLVAGEVEERGEGRRRSAAIVAASVAVAIGIGGTAAGLVRALPRDFLPGGVGDRAELQSLVGKYRPIGERIPRDDVIVASAPLALGSAEVSGKTVAPSAPAPFVADVTQRRRATATILDPEATGAARRLELDRYDVDWLVLTPDDADRLRGAGAFADGSLATDQETRTFVIVRVVDPPGSTGS